MLTATKLGRREGGMNDEGREGPFRCLFDTPCSGLK